MDTTVKSLPFDEGAERSVLGSMMIDRAAISIAEEMLVAEDFYSPRHQEIFKSIISLSSEGENVDPLLIFSDLQKRGKASLIDGIDYLLDIQDDVGLIANIRAYSKLVKDKSTERELIKICDQIIAMAYSDQEDTENLVETAEKAIFSISQEANSEGLTLIKESLIETLDNMEMMSKSDGGLTGVTTGLKDLNDHLSGLKKSELILLAARPSMGKTALGVNIAVSAAVKGNVTAIFSLEMGKSQLVQRIISQISSISLSNIISGKIGPNEWADISNAVKVVEQIPLYLDDTASISLSELRGKCRRLKAEHGLDLIVIDYLQLMTVGGRSESRQLEISEISRGLKALAKELNCPVFSLAQLSRAPELRTNKRPILSDLRESGAIEQDADVVLMLYRDDYYNEDSDSPNVAELIVAKNRNGPTGTVELFFNKEITKFGDLLYDRREE